MGEVQVVLRGGSFLIGILLCLFCFFASFTEAAGPYVKILSTASSSKEGGRVTRWDELLKAGIMEAVLKASKEMGAKGAEEVLKDRFMDFVLSYRMLERWDEPNERGLRVEVLLDKGGLSEYLKKMGVLEAETVAYLVEVRGIERYEDFVKLKELLESVGAFGEVVLREAEKGVFLWEVEVRKGIDLSQALKGLPLEVIEQKEGIIKLLWKGG